MVISRRSHVFQFLYRVTGGHCSNSSWSNGVHLPHLAKVFYFREKANIWLKVVPMQPVQCHHCEMGLICWCLTQVDRPGMGVESPSFPSRTVKNLSRSLVFLCSRRLARTSSVFPSISAAIRCMHSAAKLILQLLPWRAAHPVRICGEMRCLLATKSRSSETD